MVNQAMILAAGLGTRMKELVQDMPKPMLSVDGTSLIERHLIYLLKNNIQKVVINTHYKAEIFEEFIKSLSIYKKLNIIFSREKELLGTAGGVKNALHILGKDPFFIINSDSMFIDDETKETAFNQLESTWNSKTMPILILLSKKDKSFGYWLKGDFDKKETGLLNQDNEIREFINPGMYITDYRLFDNYNETILQFFPTVFKDLMKLGKLYGCVYNGEWFHIGDVKAYEIYHSNIKS